MDKFFGIIGMILLVLFCILLFILLLAVLICLSHPKIIIRYKDKTDIRASIWFIKFNITKFLSRKKKHKTPKAIHFEGGLFGEFPEKEKKTKKKKQEHNKTSQAHKTVKDKKEKAPLTETISEYLTLVTDILDDIKEPVKKILKVDIKKLHLTAASDDPHKTAILFGNMNTAVGSLILVCKKFAALNINENKTGVYSDFVSSTPGADAHIVLALSFRHIILCGFKAVMRFINNKKDI